MAVRLLPALLAIYFAWRFLLLRLTQSSSLRMKSIYQSLQVIFVSTWWKHYSLWKYPRIQAFLKPRKVLSPSCVEVHWQKVYINSFSVNLRTLTDARYVKQDRVLPLNLTLRIFPIFLPMGWRLFADTFNKFFNISLCFFNTRNVKTDLHWNPIYE